MASLQCRTAEDLIGLFSRINEEQRARQDALRVLHTLGPELFEQPVKGFTAPYYALKYVPNDVIVEVLKIMDRKTNLRDLRWGEERLTPLMVAGREVKKAAVDWLLANKRADPEQRREFVSYEGKRSAEATVEALHRLYQAAAGRVEEEDLRVILSVVRRNAAGAELPSGPIRRLFQANSLPLSTETLQLVFGPGTRLVEEAALEYVRRTVAHKPQAAGIINELEAHRVSSKKKVAAVLEEIKRPSTLDISYEALEGMFEEARRARTVELLRQLHVSEHAIRPLLEQPSILTYTAVAKALRGSASQLSADEWRQSMTKAAEERLKRLLREQGVEGLASLPPLPDASSVSALKLLAAVRRAIFRGTIHRHLGDDTALLIDFRDPVQDELSPLMLAARVGNVAAIQELLSLGAECNARDAKGRTALFYAIDGAREFSQYERRLLTVLDALGADYGRGASQLLDLDAQDHAGMTPLMHASAMGFVEAIKWLLLPRSLQDKRTARPDVTDHKGWTALFYATQCRDEARMRLVLRELMARGCRLDHGARDAHASFKALQLHGLLPDQGDDRPFRRATCCHSGDHPDEALRHGGVTALMLSAARGRLTCVSELLELGSDVYATDDEGWTAMHHALKQCGTEVVCRHIVTSLRKHDWRYQQSPQQQQPTQHQCTLIELPTREGQTPLMMAVQRASLELVDDLLAPLPFQPSSLPANPNSLDCRGESVVFYCIRSEQLKTEQAVQLLRLLHSKGAVVDAVHSGGLSPLMLAAQLGKVDMMGALLELQEPVVEEDGRPAMVFSVDADLEQPQGGFTALFHAVSCADPALGCMAIRVLHHYGANLNHRSVSQGCSALMLACELGHADAALTLLELGADPDLQDESSGATAVMYAIQPLQSSADYARLAERQLLVTRVLVERGGASLYHRDHAGTTALIRAVSTGMPELLAYLLSQRPLQTRRAKHERPELTPDHSTGSGLRVIDFAVASWEREQDPVSDERACAILQLLAAYGASLDVTVGSGGMTLLMKAASLHYLQTAALIAEHFASSLRRTDDRGWTALHYALSCARTDLEAARLVETLASRGANLRAAVPGPCYTPLMMAAGCGLPSTVAVILERCPEAVLDADVEGRTPLHYAICSDDATSRAGQSVYENPLVARTVEVLVDGIQRVQCPSVVNRPDKLGRSTPLMLACSRGYLQAMRRLLSLAVFEQEGRRDLVNITEAADRWGRTPLHHALEFDGPGGDRAALQRVQMLLEHGAPVQQTDRQGRNVLMLAAGRGYARTTRCLLERDMKLACRADLHQRCALHYASQRAALMNRVDRETLQVMSSLVDAMEAVGKSTAEQLLEKRMAWLPYRPNTEAPKHGKAAAATGDNLQSQSPEQAQPVDGQEQLVEPPQSPHGLDDDPFFQPNDDQALRAQSQDAPVADAAGATAPAGVEQEIVPEQDGAPEEAAGGHKGEEAAVQGEEEQQQQPEEQVEEEEEEEEPPVPVVLRAWSSSNHGYFAAPTQEQGGAYLAGDDSANKDSSRPASSPSPPPPGPPRMVRRNSLDSAFYNNALAVLEVLAKQRYDQLPEALQSLEQAPIPENPSDRERLALQQLLSEAGSLPDDLRVELLKIIGSKLQAQLQQQQANSQNKNHARRPSVTGAGDLTE